MDTSACLAGLSERGFALSGRLLDETQCAEPGRESENLLIDGRQDGRHGNSRPVRGVRQAGAVVRMLRARQWKMLSVFDQPVQIAASLSPHAQDWSIPQTIDSSLVTAFATSEKSPDPRWNGLRNAD